MHPNHYSKHISIHYFLFSFLAPEIALLHKERKGYAKECSGKKNVIPILFLCDTKTSLSMYQCKKLLLLLFYCCSAAGVLNAQNNTRLNDPNQIGWFAANATVRFAQKWAATGEVQWRRDDWVRNGQQNLFRASINYSVHPAVWLRFGYAAVETFPYGEPTLQAEGKKFLEHRTFQQALVTQDLSPLQLQHRFMLEQRWVGRYVNPAAEKADEYLYTNRFRYMARLQAPFQKPTAKGAFWYGAVWDEVFVGFGKNVQQNVFDQNRASLVVGRQFSPMVRIEGGFLSQIVQLGRRVQDRNVFQHNNGFIITTSFSLDARKKEAQ